MSYSIKKLGYLMSLASKHNFCYDAFESKNAPLITKFLELAVIFGLKVSFLIFCPFLVRSYSWADLSDDAEIKYL